MITAGCDIGSLTGKAVIMDDGKVTGTGLIRAKTSPAETAREVLDIAIENAGIKAEDIKFTIATGYGQEMITFADDVKSEIVCHAKGAYFQLPTVGLVIDIGGQDAKAIKIDENGGVSRYFYNDKCASGTGRFLEVMADALEVKVEDMGDISEESTEKVNISNQCVIFAETEVVSLVNEGKNVPDLINGLHSALANRIASLAKSVGIKEDIVMTGGVAKNKGVFKALEKGLKVPIKSLENFDPQLNGALGAAIFAKEALSKKLAA